MISLTNALSRILPCAVFVLLLARAAQGQQPVVPVSGNSPQVVVSLTDERNTDDTIFTATNSDYNDQSDPDKTSPSRVLPTNGPPHYDIFVFDTGSPAHIMSYRTTAAFDIALAGRRGTNTTPIGGAGGEFLEASNSDPIAVYVAGLSAITDTEPLGMDTSRLRGQYNVSVLNGEYNTENPDVDLPNLIGTPIASQYTTMIKNSDPQLINVDGQLHRSPDLQLYDLGSLPRPTRRLGLRFETSEGAFPVPAFIPDLSGLNINDLGDNPSIPTNTGWFFVDANVENNNVSRSQLEMLVDTGAQGTIVSEQVAVTLGFDVETDEPDFVVRIQGVTGTSEEVPGFIAERFTLPGTGGGLTLENVPLIVFNLTDPRDNFSTLPGLLGMNVFADRDITINPEPGAAYLGVSDPVFDVRTWATSDAVASWNAPANWDAPDAPQVQWSVYADNVTGTPQTALMAADSTVGNFVARGHATQETGTMSVQLEPGTTLTVYGSAIIEAGATVHLNEADLAPLAVEIRGGTLSGVGTIEGEVLNQGYVSPGSTGTTGTLSFAGSLDQLSEGHLEIDLGDYASDDFDHVEVSGAMTLNGKLSLATTQDYVPPDEGETHRFTIVQSDDRIFDAFASYSFNDITIGADCAADGSKPCTSLGANNFREHVGDGRFISVAYLSDSVSVSEFRAISGDANGDGQVQFDDFLSLSDSFGTPGDWLSGDFSGNGLIGFEDFLLLSANFGKSAAALSVTGASVPEPGALSLSMLAVVALMRRRQRR